MPHVTQATRSLPSASAALWSVAGASGLFRFARRATRSVVPVLTYHRVKAGGPWVTGPRDPNIVSTSEFDREIAHLARHYHLVTGAEFHGFITQRQPLPAHSVLVTFDDGYADNFREA